jgi:hypothetical protein
MARRPLVILEALTDDGETLRLEAPAFQVDQHGALGSFAHVQSGLAYVGMRAAGKPWRLRDERSADCMRFSCESGDLTARLNDDRRGVLDLEREVFELRGHDEREGLLADNPALLLTAGGDDSDGAYLTYSQDEWCSVAAGPFRSRTVIIAQAWWFDSSRLPLEIGDRSRPSALAGGIG